MLSWICQNLAQNQHNFPTKVNIWHRYPYIIYIHLGSYEDYHWIPYLCYVIILCVTNYMYMRNHTHALQLNIIYKFVNWSGKNFIVLMKRVMNFKTKPILSIYTIGLIFSLAHVKTNEEFDFDGLPGVTYEMKFEVQAGHDMCFHQKIRKDARIFISYEVYIYIYVYVRISHAVLSILFY